MGRPELCDDPRFARLADRAAHGDEINQIVADWTASLPAHEVEARCVDHDVPIATAYTAADIASDEHMLARGDLVTVMDSVIGPVRQQAPFPRFVGEPVRVPSSAPLLGEHNTEVWCGQVGLGEDELQRYAESGII
jgi:crotonobetainyl-CoA:carnitine CoA-transferase CaiB-like acyl-CoA transferase